MLKEIEKVIKRIEKNKELKPIKKEKGITLIALIVTIIILIILAGVTIATLTGEDGLINNANNAKEETEIANEKEIVDRATINAMGNNKRGNIVREELQDELDRITKVGDTEVEDSGEEFNVVFTQTQRYYTVNKDGDIIEEGKIVVDKYPGDITVGENGEELDGSEEHPYQINCIEDLVAVSNLSRGSGIIFENGKIKELTENEKTNFNYKYIVITRNLNFKSKYSYANSERTDFEDINGNENDGNTLINEMTTGTGFRPIEAFRGILDGNGKKLSNLYEKNVGNLGVINDLTAGKLRNLEVTGEIVCSGDTAGGIVAKNGTVENCINRVDIKATGNQIGGVLGLNGVAKNCKNYGNIEGISQIGGIGGRYIKAENCENYGDIGNELSDTSIGGIVGQTTTGLINNCINQGNLVGKMDVGGIAGNPMNVRMINCMNLGEIKGTEGVGGITGRGTNFYCIMNCNNLGKVIGEKNVGGIIGKLEYISNTMDGKIINCYNVGDLDAKSYVGGIVGVKSGYGTHYIENCYWKKELNLDYGTNNSSSGILQVSNTKAYTEGEMKQTEFLQILNQYVETYNSGDKEYTEGNELQNWKLDSNTGFPISTNN